MCGLGSTNFRLFFSLPWILLFCQALSCHCYTWTQAPLAREVWAARGLSVSVVHALISAQPSVCGMLIKPSLVITCPGTPLLHPCLVCQSIACPKQCCNLSFALLYSCSPPSFPSVPHPLCSSWHHTTMFQIKWAPFGNGSEAAAFHSLSHPGWTIARVVTGNLSNGSSLRQGRHGLPLFSHFQVYASLLYTFDWFPEWWSGCLWQFCQLYSCLACHSVMREVRSLQSSPSV